MKGSSRAATALTSAPFAPTRFAPPDIAMRRDADGTVRLVSKMPLGDYDRQVGVWLRRWADAAPDRLFLAERASTGAWREVTYGAARTAADRLSQALLDLGLGRERPLAILSEKSVDHALLTLAAMQIGITVVPISPAYSLLPPAIERLRHATTAIVPVAIFVEDGPPFERALNTILKPGQKIIYGRRPPGGIAAIPLAALTATAATRAVDAAFHVVGPDDVAKVFFTSGSTGTPKPVPHTHRMMCSNQQAVAQLFPCFEETPPVIVDWQPWHHVGGANFNYHIGLRNGGTYYIDGGKPTEDAIGTTIENLRSVSPTIHFNVPRGYAMLIPYLERDAALRDTFFRKLQIIVYSAASLPPELWARLEALSVAARGVRVPMISAWGTTELAPLHTTAHWPIDRAGLIGAPIPGSEVKLAPTQGRFEMRARGPNVMSGYIGQPELTASVFDDEGFLMTGDAGYLLDPEDPNKGLVYDGRLTENFKLLTGNWVAVGALRVAVIDFGAPVIQDVVVTGENRERLGLLVFPNLAHCRALAGDGATNDEAVLSHPRVITTVRRAIDTYNADNSASSRRVELVLLMTEPASLEAGEITDKGYVNQRAVLARRANLVDGLYDGSDARALRF
jgi:feruloyl-CoA synthase